MGKKQENTRNENYNDYRFKAYRNIFSCGNRSFTFMIFGLLRYLKFGSYDTIYQGELLTKRVYKNIVNVNI